MYPSVVKVKVILIFWIASVLSLFFMGGCAKQPPIRSAPVTIVGSPTIPVSTNIPTESPTVPTPTLKPTSDVYEAVTECIPVESQIPQNVEMRGGLFFYSRPNKYSSETVLMNLSTKAITELEKNDFRVDTLKVSPDGKWVAYFLFNTNNYSGERLFVENFVTGSVMEIPLSKEWGLFSLRRWLNDKNVLITTLENTNYPPSFIALNPFTKDILTLPSTFPDQELLSPLTKVSVAEYDPSLNYVIYPAQKNDIDGFALFNRATNEQIVFSPAQTLVEVGSPKWSHDGQKYVFLSKKQSTGAYNMGTVDGDVKLLSYLPKEMTSFIVNSLSWSPDDKYVAVIIFDVGQKLEKLILLDTVRKKVIDPCIEVNYGYWPFASDFPIWSPGGHQIIVEKQSEYGKNEVILIDLSKMQAGILAHDERVLGWISLEP